MLLKINLTAIHPNILHDEDHSIVHNFLFSVETPNYPALSVILVTIYILYYFFITNLFSFPHSKFNMKLQFYSFAVPCNTPKATTISDFSTAPCSPAQFHKQNMFKFMEA